MKKFKLVEEIKKGRFGIPYDMHLVLPVIYVYRKLRKYRKGQDRAIHALGIMMANITIGDLRKIYKKQLSTLKKNIDDEYDLLPHVNSRKIWVCWMQGIENAPQVVKVCYQSILEHLSDREIVLITSENYSQYVEIPDFILKKYKKGIISHTHFSDILRLELLKKYGGTWIDATVFLTDGNLPSYMLEDKLFIFQSIQDMAVQIESFFITAESNNKIISLTLELLYEYWKKKNVLVHYILMFYFFKIATEEYAVEWANVIPFSSFTARTIDFNLENQYNEHVFKEILKLTPVHKLTYKKPISEGTYFDYIMKNYKSYQTESDLKKNL